jgi:nucleotide-binding universal stress UspA family protein
MTAIKRILVPIDFSEFSRHALDSAVAIARQQQATVMALHVVPPLQTVYPAVGVSAYVPYVYSAGELQEFQHALERFVATVDHPVTAVSVEALVVDEISQASRRVARRSDRDGDARAIGIRPLVLGSVAERVLVKATCRC